MTSSYSFYWLIDCLVYAFCKVIVKVAKLSDYVVYVIWFILGICFSLSSADHPTLLTYRKIRLGFMVFILRNFSFSYEGVGVYALPYNFFWRVEILKLQLICLFFYRALYIFLLWKSISSYSDIAFVLYAPWVYIIFPYNLANLGISIFIFMSYRFFSRCHGL